MEQMSALRKIWNLLKGKDYLTLEDDYIRRLRCSVIGEGMLPPPNIYLMDYAIQRMPDEGCILEIGCYAGLSTNVLLYLANKHKKQNTMYAADAWVYEGYKDYTGVIEPHMDGRTDINRADYANYIKEMYIKSTSFFNSTRLPHTFHKASDELFAAWGKTELTDIFGTKAMPAGKIAFAYIDGNHAYDYAMRDVNNTINLLAKGGYLLLDDSADYLNFGSVKVAQQLLSDNRVRLAKKNMNYLFQKI